MKQRCPKCGGKISRERVTLDRRDVLDIFEKSNSLNNTRLLKEKVKAGLRDGSWGPHKGFYIRRYCKFCSKFGDGETVPSHLPSLWEP